ncbi:unnamed protein product [Lactuca saligna]|uniref:RING-type E3 ubiquitin transferase n=1 Tax=Lactuca saligna TaxID=75948 RepID=A0AA35ZJC6_LACSI|nr:unnamed protein product [Lactuca saligna]
MANSKSWSNPHVTLEIREENPYPYPYPSYVCAPNFVTFKLNDKDEYDISKTQMLCLLESHSVSGFIDGTLISPDEASSSSSFSGKEKVVDNQTHQKLWRRSNALVKGWVLVFLSKETLAQVVNSLRGKLHEDDFSAKDVWDELQTIFAPAVVPKLHVVEGTIHLLFTWVGDLDKSIGSPEIVPFYTTRSLQWVEEILRELRVTVIDKITNNGNTALHVAFDSSKKLEFLEKLLEKILKNTQLMDVINSDGSTLLRVAAIIGNTEAVGILVARKPELLFAKDNKDLTQLALALSNMHTETTRHLLQHINNTINDDIEKDALFSGSTGDGLLVTAISSKDFHLARDMLEHYKSLHSDDVLMSITQNFPRKVKVFERYAGVIRVEAWRLRLHLGLEMHNMLRVFIVRVGILEVMMGSVVLVVSMVLMVFRMVSVVLVVSVVSECPGCLGRLL